ncbi:Permease of the drug/metabolite transporter (DMT) superfamily [Alteribacillus persepolensis]|uniref:Permease of the drug/metabolite transporter (DMT) superfamily n=1 Tax=Alteribacillus persepolensis TaxID=568899 RepID=A0A1G8FNG6_9BACI|nr:EamA family transporter [Alteribacillus persepolensis]SDH83614.1 Permease of the drug/metabolite transporter (DMT) superfamily [Alteribacillus persepolensis]
MKAYVFLFLTVIIFSGNIIVGKAINELPPYTIAFFRVFIAFLIVLPIGFKQAKEHRHVFQHEWKPLLGLALTGVAFFNSFIYAALQFTSSTNVAIMESAIPVVTILFSMIFLKEKLLGVQWLGVILSVSGAVWVITEGSWQVIRGFAFNAGDIIMVAAVLTWVAYSILVKFHMTKFPIYGSLLVMLAAANVVLFPIAATEWIIGGFPAVFQFNHLLGLLYLGIFPSLIALILWNKGVEEVGPSQASVFLNLLPVFTILGSLLFLGEDITMIQVFGALVVISGVLLTTKTRKVKVSRAKAQEYGMKTERQRVK